MAETAPAVKSAERALAVVELVADRGSVSFPEILDALALPRSSAHGLLATLTTTGWLDRGPDRRYTLGLKTWEVGQRYGGHRDVIDLVRPFMDRLRTELGETVQLARLDGAENVYIAISHSPHPMRLASSVGVRLPAHATGIGKALFSVLEEDDVRARLGDGPLRRMTASTVTDVDELLAIVRRAREKGAALDDGEYVEGCVCVAVPLGRDPHEGGAPVAISVTTPSSRAPSPWPDAYLGPLREVVAEIRSAAPPTVLE